MTVRTLTARLAALALALCLAAGTAMAADPIESMSLPALRALIQQNKGRPVVLNFFATWCPPCRAEIPMLVDMHGKYGKRVTFVGLTVDDARTIGKVGPFVQQMKIGYPVYQAGSDVVRSFSISSIPFNVGYDRKGKLVFAYSGIVDEDDFARMLDDMLK